MELRQLRFFLMTAKEGSISKAAKMLHISQPALSRALKDMEDEIGKTLIVRDTHHLFLSPEGRLLKKRAEEILALYEKTKDELNSRTEMLEGTISIGGILPNELLSLCSKFRSEHPAITFSFRSGDAQDLKDLLDQGNLDFAIFVRPVDSKHLHSIRLPQTTRWGVVLPAKEAKGRTTISPAEFAKLPLIIPRRQGIQDLLHSWCAPDSEQLQIAASFNSFQGSPLFVVQYGLGALVITENHLIDSLPKDLCFLPLDPPLVVGYAMVWKKDAIFQDASKAFLDAVRSAFLSAPELC